MKNRSKEICELRENIASLQEDIALKVHQLHLENEKAQNRPLLTPALRSLPLRYEADQKVGDYHFVDEEKGEGVFEGAEGAPLAVMASISSCWTHRGCGTPCCQAEVQNLG